MRGTEHSEKVAQRNAILANSGFVLLCVSVGGLGAEIFQLWALEVLNLSPGQVGVAFGLMIVSIPVQLVAVGWLNKYGPQRVMICGYFGIAVGLAGFQLVTAISDGPHRTATFLLFLLFVVWTEICISCSWGNAWFPWVGRMTTTDTRPRFLRRMRLVTQGTYVAGTFAFTLAIASRPEPSDFQFLFALLMLYVVAAMWKFRRMPPGTQAAEAPTDLRSGLRDPHVRRTVWLVLFRTTMAVPLLASWLLLAEYPAYVVTLGGTVQALVGVVALIALGPVLDKWPAPRIITRFGVMLAGTCFLWLLLPSYGGEWDTVIYLTLVVVTATLTAGFTVGWFAILYDFLPERSTNVGFALVDLVSSSSLQLYALLVGMLLGLLANTESSAALHMYKGLFLVAAMASAYLALVAHRVQQSARVS